MHPVGLGLFGVCKRLQAVTPLHQQPRTLFPAFALLKRFQRLVRLFRQAHRNSSRPWSSASKKRCTSSLSLYKPSDTRIAPSSPSPFSSGMAQW